MTTTTQAQIQIAAALNISANQITRCEEWATVYFVVIAGKGGRFVSKKVIKAPAKSVSLVNEYSNQIVNFGGFNRAKRNVIEGLLAHKLSGMKADGLLTASEWCGLDAVWYGINWYLQTGRATVEIEKELAALTGRQLIRLIVKIWLDGANTCGDAGDWLRNRQGCYARLIR